MNFIPNAAVFVLQYLLTYTSANTTSTTTTYYTFILWQISIR